MCAFAFVHSWYQHMGMVQQTNSLQAAASPMLAKAQSQYALPQCCVHVELNIWTIQNNGLSLVIF